MEGDEETLVSESEFYSEGLVETPLIRERVERGIAYLDRMTPGWDQRIDLEMLDMNSCTRCVLGQLYGDYEHGLTKIGLRAPYAAWMEAESTKAAVNYGFFTRRGISRWDRLTELWRELLQARRSSATPEATQ